MEVKRAHFSAAEKGSLSSFSIPFLLRFLRAECAAAVTRTLLPDRNSYPGTPGYLGTKVPRVPWYHYYQFQRSKANLGLCTGPVPGYREPGIRGTLIVLVPRYPRYPGVRISKP
eukprot:279063-Rhodomonas_salina.4